MASILNENPRDAEMWCEALKAKFDGKGEAFKRSDWDQLLGHCQAVTDTPSILFWRELFSAYPNVKVILTVRDSAEAWFKSQMSTIQPFAAGVYPPNPTWWQRLRKYLLPVTAIDKMFMLLLKHHPQFQTGLYDLEHDSGTSKIMYEKWNADVIRTVPKDQLLVFNPKQGWTPLCNYLDVAVPDQPFPKINDGDTWRRHNAGLPRLLSIFALITLAKYLGIVTVVCGTVFYLGRNTK